LRHHFEDSVFHVLCCLKSFARTGHVGKNLGQRVAGEGICHQ
jgi:hypothetical protein